MTGLLRVFLLDDHEVVRRGVRELVDAELDMHVVGEAATAATALPTAFLLRPDVAVLDVRLPDGDGVEVCRDLRAAMPDLACLMLTSYADDEALVASVIAGAAGYVLKQVGGQDLVAAIRTVAAGGSLLDPQATSIVLDRLRAHPQDDPFANLSTQERRVLELLADGLTNRQIGEHMGLAEKTVKNYVSAILVKLGLPRRTQAAVLATQVRRSAAIDSAVSSFQRGAARV